MPTAPVLSIAELHAGRKSEHSASLWVRLCVVQKRGRLSDGFAGDEVAGRLADLGLIPGEAFEFLGAAPWGEPYFICVRDATFALRREEAERLKVQVLELEPGDAGGAG